jgi:hypothetical protein
VRVAVPVLLAEEQRARLAQKLHDARVGLEHTHPGEVLHVRREAAGRVDGAIDFQAVGLADDEVVVAVPRSGVD